MEQERPRFFEYWQVSRKPDEGQVVMQNGLRITYLPQHPEFPEGATILSYVTQGQKEQSWNSETEAHMVLNKLGIEDHEEEIAHLSGGQKKRVALGSRSRESG